MFTAKRDTLFNVETKAPEALSNRPFKFDAAVAEVFDDMVTRSVPGYYDMQLLTAKMVRKYSSPGERVYDLGCSSGTTIAFIKKTIHFPLNITGIDSSQAMLENCAVKLGRAGFLENVTLRCEDILASELETAAATIFNLTLQFVSPEKRVELLKKAYAVTKPGGVIIISEKVIHESPSLGEHIKELHWEFKGEAGYSELEIAQKRNSLENVLVPLAVKENIEMIKCAGFSEVELIYKNLNFATFVGIRSR